MPLSAARPVCSHLSFFVNGSSSDWKIAKTPSFVWTNTRRGGDQFGSTQCDIVPSTAAAFIPNQFECPIGLKKSLKVPIMIVLSCVAARKFRDETRPRFGLMRGREFVMKVLLKIFIFIFYLFIVFAVTESVLIGFVYLWWNSTSSHDNIWRHLQCLLKHISACWLAFCEGFFFLQLSCQRFFIHWQSWQGWGWHWHDWWITVARVSAAFGCGWGRCFILPLWKVRCQRGTCRFCYLSLSHTLIEAIKYFFFQEDKNLDLIQC